MMETTKDLSSLSENDFIQILRNILDEYFHRLPSTKRTIDIDPQVRLQLEYLLRSTNPSSAKNTVKDLPENFQQLYLSFVNDYQHDIERYHIYQASKCMDKLHLNNFDWNIRLAVHDENLFKCRLPLINLQLELSDGKDSKDVLLELDEQELNRLIDEMTKINQSMSHSATLS